MFYLIIFVILFLLAGLNLQFKDKLSTQILMMLGSMLLIVVGGLRYETGGDWDTYEEFFASVPRFDDILRYPKLLLQQEMEGGFVLICSIIRWCGGGVQWMFFIVTLINISLIASALPKYTKLPLIGLLAYYSILFFNLEMIYIRQATSVALCFVALQYIKPKKIIHYTLLVVCAAMFHRLAILMIPLYFVLDKKLPAWVYISVIGVGCIVMLTGIPWFKTIFVAVGRLLGAGFEDKAIAYTTTAKFAVERTISIGFFVNLILFACMMIFKKGLDKQENGTIHLNMFAISLVIYYYCYELVEVSNRARLFFLISVIVVLPQLVDCMGNFMSRLIAYIPTALYCFTFAMGIMLERPEAAAYNPYQNYIVYKWQGKPSTGKQRLERSKHSFNQQRRR